MFNKSMLGLLVLLSLSACDKKPQQTSAPSESSAATSGASTSDASTSTAPAAPAQPATQALAANARTINAQLKSFSCGADACYLSFSTANSNEASAICADSNYCDAWSLVNTGEEYGSVNLAQENNPRVKLTISSDMFEPAGENMDHVRRIEFLQE